MAYCTVDDIRAEGFDEETYPDELVESRIALAKTYIDRRTGVSFERVHKTYHLDGNGKQYLELPLPVCQGEGQLESVIVGKTNPLELVSYIVVYNEEDEKRWPRIWLDEDFDDLTSEEGFGYIFTKGRKNITVEGYFGFVDYEEVVPEGGGDPVPTWTTPVEIQRVAMRLVARDLPALSDLEGQAGRQDFRIQSETTRYRSVTLAALARTGGPTGDPDIDEPLAAYTRPPFMTTV